MHKINVVIIASNDVSRSGLQALTAAAGTFVSVTAAFADFQGLDSYMQQNRVDVLLIDDSLPRSVNIGDAIKRLLYQHPGLAVIVLSSRPIASVIRRVLDRGARGFIHKDDPLTEALLIGIEAVRRGGTYLSPRVSSLLKLERSRPTLIDERALDVLRLMVDGYTAGEIARQMGIGVKTVYRIQTALRETLEARTNEQLMDAARKKGLLDDHRE
ncbi:MAG: response regulator transcription factor [Anaerolineae bacterium]|nr:response regulator transcription factor [Anaerolineae bacterium]